MRLPKSYKDITVEQYQEIREVLQKDSESIDTWVRIVCILTNKQIEEIENLKADHLKWVFSQISWIRKPELKGRKRKYIFAGGRLYKACFYAQKLNTAQYVDLKSFLKEGDADKNLHKLLACVYLPLTWKGFDYSGEKHVETASRLRKVKMGRVYPTVFFYSKVWKNSIKAIQESGIKKAENLMLQSLEAILSEISESNGDGKLLSTN